MRTRQAIPTDSSLRSLWDRFAATRSPADRRAIAEAYLPLVRIVAGNLWRTLAMRYFDRNELISVGTVGLIQAVERFDPSAGVYFYAFATPRVRGAILDWLRQEDRIPRRWRNRINAADGARDLFAAEHARQPTQSELAEVMGVTVAQVAGIERAARHAAVGIGEVEQVRQSREPAPDHRAEIGDELAAALAEFPPYCRAMLRARAEGTARREDVAATFGLTAYQGRGRLDRSLAKFRKRMQTCGA